MPDQHPSDLSPAAFANQTDQPKIMTLGERFRKEPLGLTAGAGFVSAIFALVPGFFALMISNHGRPDFTWGTAIAVYLIAVALAFMPFAAMWNSFDNDDVRSEAAKKKLDEEEAAQTRQFRVALTESFRLPLLEWAVKNNAVDDIAGLDEVLADRTLKFVEEQRLKAFSDAKAKYKPSSSS